MTRDEKIRAIQDIKAGLPAHIALNRDKYKILYKNQSQVFFKTASGEKVSKENKEKYFSDSIIVEYVNVSKQFPFE